MKNRKLIILSEQYHKSTQKDGEYGGKGPYELPSNHVAGMHVPKGGSSCANCKYLEEKNGEYHCKSIYFIQWNGGESKIPTDDPEAYCSDWYDF